MRKFSAKSFTVSFVFAASLSIAGLFCHPDDIIRMPPGWTAFPFGGGYDPGSIVKISADGTVSSAFSTLATYMSQSVDQNTLRMREESSGATSISTTDALKSDLSVHAASADVRAAIDRMSSSQIDIGGGTRSYLERGSVVLVDILQHLSQGYRASLKQQIDDAQKAGGGMFFITEVLSVTSGTYSVDFNQEISASAQADIAGVLHFDNKNWTSGKRLEKTNFSGVKFAFKADPINASMLGDIHPIYLLPPYIVLDPSGLPLYSGNLLSALQYTVPPGIHKIRIQSSGTVSPENFDKDWTFGFDVNVNGVSYPKTQYFRRSDPISPGISISLDVSAGQVVNVQIRGVDNYSGSIGRIGLRLNQYFQIGAVQVE